jgi:hypothetical protein
LISYAVLKVIVSKGCPLWRNEMGKNVAASFKEVIRKVDMPETDPVYGENGPLNQLWHSTVLAKL